MGHIELARWAERILVAPASADLMARLAHGMADDLLTTLCLASAAPLYLAPAMNQQMWAHPAVQANVETLQASGCRLLGRPRVIRPAVTSAVVACWSRTNCVTRCWHRSATQCADGPAGAGQRRPHV